MAESEKEKEEWRLSELIKKVVTTGVGAAFMTEDAIRKHVGELPLPSEIVQNIIKNANQSKTELMQSIRKEFASYLERANFSKEVDRILENYDIELQATIQFKKRNGKASPSVKMSKKKTHSKGSSE